MLANKVERMDGQPANRFDRLGNRLPWWTLGGLFVPNEYRPQLYKNPDWFAQQGELPKDQFIPWKGSRTNLENPFDLRNLRIFASDQVQKTLENLVDNHRSGKKSFIMIGFGGTIGSTMTSEGSAVPGVDVGRILEYTGRDLHKRYTHASLSFPTLIMSSQMRTDYIADTVIAMSWIYKKMPQEVKDEFMGFMVSHGTDTMSPSATHMAMMLGPNLDFTVGFTGSQISIDESLLNDVPDNISRTLATMELMHDESKHMVFLYMGGATGGAMHPAGAIKESDSRIEGFVTPVIPKILDASDTRHHSKLVTPFLSDYSEVRDSAIDIFQPVIYRGFSPVMTVRAQPDKDPQAQYDEIVAGARNHEIVALETFGTFTMPDYQLKAILQAREYLADIQNTRFHLVAANPFPTGSTRHTDIESRRLIDQGVHPLDILPHVVGPKALVGQTLYGLADIGYGGYSQRRLFLHETDYIGERPPGWQDGNLEPLPEEIRRVGRARQTIYMQPVPVFPR